MRNISSTVPSSSTVRSLSTVREEELLPLACLLMYDVEVLVSVRMPALTARTQAFRKGCLLGLYAGSR